MSVFNAYELHTLKWSILLCILYPDWVFQCVLYLLISFYIGVWLICSVVLGLGVQQSESAIHTHTSSFFQILFPYWLLQNIE